MIGSTNKTNVDVSILGSNSGVDDKNIVDASFIIVSTSRVDKIIIIGLEHFHNSFTVDLFVHRNDRNNRNIADNSFTVDSSVHRNGRNNRNIADDFFVVVHPHNLWLSK